MGEVVETVSGIRTVADGPVDEVKRLLPGRRETQRGNTRSSASRMSGFHAKPSPVT